MNTVINIPSLSLSMFGHSSDHALVNLGFTWRDISHCIPYREPTWRAGTLFGSAYLEHLCLARLYWLLKGRYTDIMISRRFFIFPFPVGAWCPDPHDFAWRDAEPQQGQARPGHDMTCWAELTCQKDAGAIISNVVCGVVVKVPRT